MTDDNENTDHENGLDALPKPGGHTSRIAVTFANELGYPRVAEVITKWPELIGKGLAAPFKKIQDLKEKGQAITPDLEQEARAAIEQNQEDMTRLIGMLFAASLEEMLDAENERQEILLTFKHHLEFIGNIAEELKTSVALRGFLHSKECVSYWHGNKGRGIDKSIFQQPKDKLELTPLPPYSIYVLDIEPTKEKLLELNQMIRRDETRSLPPELYDHRKTPNSGKVIEIMEFNVVIEQCDDNEILFGLSGNPKGHPIPDGAPLIEIMFESLIPALETQQGHIRGIREAFARIQSKNPG